MFRKILTQPIPIPPIISRTRNRWRHWRLIDVLLLWPTGILCGVLSGALMNGINSFVSPYAFRPNFDPSFLFLSPSLSQWEGAVQQGIWEGFWFGIAFSLIFTFHIAFISRLSCPYKIGVRALLRTIGLLWAVWLLCGLNALLMRKFAPNWLDFAGGFLSNRLGSQR